MNILFQNRNAMKIKILRYHNVIENWNLQIMEEIKMKINEYQELAMTTLNPELNKKIPLGWSVASIATNPISNLIKPGLNYFDKKE